MRRARLPALPPASSAVVTSVRASICTSEIPPVIVSGTGYRGGRCNVNTRMTCRRHTESLILKNAIL